ncbi:hypothetical protein ACZ90_20400 [Streptomyces albus subsp. albus]|nr:hypothetical protein ACZ90_20400 [Streptomyces albus subsp. albus]
MSGLAEHGLVLEMLAGPLPGIYDPTGPGKLLFDMLHTVPRRKALGESVEQIQPSLIIPTGKRKGQNPSVASIHRALAGHEKTPVPRCHGSAARRGGPASRYRR